MNNKESKQNYGTVPFMILTEMLAMGLDINPFYRATREEVLNNYEYAKECYYKIRKGMISSWCIRECLEAGIIEDDSLNYLVENNDKVLNAIKQHKIKPMPMIEFAI